jgi:branched-chain amino acid transport system substrate-binding protein
MPYYVSRLRMTLSFISTMTLVLIVCAACGGPAAGNQAKTPIKIGVSLSLSGDFSSDGQAFKQGYQLWADALNKKGGLLGRPVQLDIVSDASSAQQVVTNYQKLINVDKVDLVFGPYSTLLTKPASQIANRYGYAMLEGAGGGPTVFDQGLHNVFDVSLPIANNLVSFAKYILALPIAQRPKTAAYATEDDPFTQPQIDIAKQLLEQGGVKTASYQVYPAETTDYSPIATKVIRSGAQIDVLGTFLPDITAFIQDFKQQHYNPQALVATSGPDQGDQFIKAVGASSANGIFVPNGWYPGATNAGNADMVKAYLAKYGGTADAVSADIAESYSVGQVLEQAVDKIHSVNNAALIKELHSSDAFDSVQGSVKFDNSGQNTAAQAYLFQWQQTSLLPVYPSDAAKSPPLFPRPQWA